MNAKEIEQEITEKEYKDILDKLYPEVSIGSLTFRPGDIVEKMNPTAFRCGKLDYEDTLGEKWQCSVCKEEFDNDEEAEECCQARQLT